MAEAAPWSLAQACTPSSVKSRNCCKPSRPAGRRCSKTSIGWGASSRAPRSWSCIIVALGLVRGQPFLEMLIFGIALAVAVVPEALPAVVTISLAIGVQRMAKRHALIRRLPAVETFGSVSVIGSDKTGTLTKDEMTVRKIFVAGQMLNVSGAGYEPRGEFSRNGTTVEPAEALVALLRAAALASDAHLAHDDATQPVASERGSHRRRSGGCGGQGRLRQARARRGIPAHRRNSVHVGKQAHDDFAYDTRRRGGLC